MYIPEGCARTRCGILVIKALVFDMDGLLFDSERVVQRSWEDAGNVLGLPAMGSHIYNTLGMNRTSRHAYFEREVGKHFPHDAFSEKTRERFWEIVEAEGLPVKSGARELITYASAGGLKIALATSSRSDYAFRNLKEAGIYDCFDGFVCGDMVSRSKPDPEIYLKACACVGVNPQNAIALEDSPAGIRSAYAAGMYPIMIQDLVQPDEEVAAMLLRRFKTLGEVIGLLAELNE